MRDKSLKELSLALGKDASWLSKKKLPHDDSAGVKRYDVEECRAWIASNVRERNFVRPGPAVVPPAGEVIEIPVPRAPAVPVPKREVTPREKELLGILISEDERPEAVVRRAEASHMLSCIAVAQGYEEGNLGSREFEDLRKQSEELRKVRSDFLDIAEREGRLIPRDVAKSVGASLALRLNAILNAVENSIATKFEIWLGDETFRALSTENRGREIRQWFEAQSRALREADVNEVEMLIKEKLRDAEENS